MANVKVAVRVRPLNQREKDMGCHCILDVEGAKTTIVDPKSRGVKKSFTYDYSYWSTDPSHKHFAPQEKVFSDLGTEVLQSAQDGYNACVFAYGQTGSGKTYTMMGLNDAKGLIPRICEGLFDYIQTSSGSVSFKTEVSYLEIYNEKARDLLRPSSGAAAEVHNLRVREHPREGPYVENLTKHLVSDYSAISELMDLGNSHRVTASTLMNDVSSRSHAIFTLTFTQAKFEHDSPSETVSRINLVDLAGSERASATGASGDRLKEGASINRSLVTLGNVISALAEMGAKMATKGFIPYRDSVLTWLLKDSLGGNAKTIMVTTVSPADSNYGETLSALRYANRAKNILNRPTINEDSNVKLIRELKAEIEKLKSIILSDVSLSEKLLGLTSENIHKKEEQVAELTKTWAGKWKDMQQIIEERELALHSEGVKMMVASELPHFIGVDDDILSTGVVLYHLASGTTAVGSAPAANCSQHIVLEAPDIAQCHCRIENCDGVVTLHPGAGECFVNGDLVTQPTRLAQGGLVRFGAAVVVRFNHPQEALRLREERRRSGVTERQSATSSNASLLSVSLSSPVTNQALKEERERFDKQRLEFERKKEEIEREFEEKVALIRHEVELEKERLREELAVGGVQHWRSGASGSPSAFRSGSSSPLADMVHPEVEQPLGCEWGAREALRSSSTCGSCSSMEESTSGVLPCHYRQVLGEESETDKTAVLAERASTPNANGSLESCSPNVQGKLCEPLSTVPHPPDHSPMLQEGHALSNAQDHSPSKREGHTLSNAQDHSPSQREGHTLSNAQDHSPSQREGHTLSNAQDHSPSQREGHTLSNAQDHSPSQREGQTLSTAQDPSPSQREGETLSTAQDPSPSRPPLPRTQSQFASALEEKESLLKQHEDTISEQLKSKAELEERLRNLEKQVKENEAVKAPVVMGARSDGSVQRRKTQSVSVSVPGYGRRRKGSSAYYVYEVKIAAGREEWTVSRRYSQFKSLHADLLERFKELQILVFPGTKLFGTRTPNQLRQRQHFLERYLTSLIALCSNIPECEIYDYGGNQVDRKSLAALHPFFVPNVVEAPVDFSVHTSPYDDRWTSGCSSDDG